MKFEAPVQKVIDEFARLPGIGAKTAQRLAFHLMSLPKEAAERLGEAILEMTDKVKNCGRCFNLTSEALCSICRDTRRDHTLVCVVERPQDISVIERTNEFRGGYHVLGGALSPLRGIGPEQLRIPELEQRLMRMGLQRVAADVSVDRAPDDVRKGWRRGPRSAVAPGARRPRRPAPGASLRAGCARPDPVRSRATWLSRPA